MEVIFASEIPDQGEKKGKKENLNARDLGNMALGRNGKIGHQSRAYMPEKKKEGRGGFRRDHDALRTVREEKAQEERGT